MSFFSSSSRRKHYKHGHHGSNHYQKKGLLGKLLNNIMSSSWSHKQHYGNQHYPQQHINPPQHINPSIEQPGHLNVQQNPVICTKCNSRIPAGSKFCLQCGEKVLDSLFCSNCGEKLPSDAKFCLKCGLKI
jgi:ribosomal protein L40E